MRWTMLASTILLAACGRAPSEERPRAPERAESVAELFEPTVEWPADPAASAELAACLRDYRAQAAAPYPDRAPGQDFRAWYAGPFDAYVQRYNATRERCDTIFADLDPAGEQAQAMLGLQSWAHERMGQRAIPYEEEGVMFVMGRYWTLGAACTYARCAEGPSPAWARLCRERAAQMPACPPVEPAAEPSGGAPEDPSTDGPTAP
jgi:hypothetical protein